MSKDTTFEKHIKSIRINLNILNIMNSENQCYWFWTKKVYDIHMLPQLFYYYIPLQIIEKTQIDRMPAAYRSFLAETRSNNSGRYTSYSLDLPTTSVASSLYSNCITLYFKCLNCWHMCMRWYKIICCQTVGMICYKDKHKLST